MAEDEIPEPTRDDLLRLAHAEYRDQLASGQLPAKHAAEIWEALRKQWYEEHRAAAARRAAAEESPPAEPPHTEPESSDPELPQAPNIIDVANALFNSELAKFWTPRPDQKTPPAI